MMGTRENDIGKVIKAFVAAPTFISLKVATSIAFAILLYIRAVAASAEDAFSPSHTANCGACFFFVQQHVDSDGERGDSVVGNHGPSSR
jgi:hypothetical protein